VSHVRWPTAVRIAGRVAGSYPLEGTYHDALFQGQAPQLVARAAELVALETGLTGPGNPEVAVVSRRSWVESNVAVFSKLLAPAEEKLEERASGFAKAFGGRLVAVELGALLGVLARRVLGQYEMVLPTGDEEAGDVVYFVGANVLWLERQHEFRPSEFRFWVALHECTHRLQFVGVPWMRDYFLSLVTDLVASATPEPGRFAKAAAELRASTASGEPLIGEAGLLGVFATDLQRGIIDKVQALMSLLEGHGHVIMDRIGAREIPSQGRMSRVLRQRRKDPRMAAFLRLTGLEMKMRQYELGERFVLAVDREAGFSTLDRAWEGPDMLPTLDEIKEPQRWLSRIA
jgi:coenzyme F420 biosynthesis associated uncharacterized protein